MKSSINHLVALIAIILISSSSCLAAPPKLYPQIVSYFQSLGKGQQKSGNVSSLETLKYNFRQTNRDTIVMVCSGNSFRSQALQVFLETNLTIQKKSKLEVLSCGYKAIEIDERLMTYLQKLGYRIERTQYEGKRAYMVRFSDSHAPIVLYPKTCDDRVMPAKPFISVLACQEAQGTCEKLAKSDIKIKLDYKDRYDLTTAEAFESEVNQIAADINYIFEK